MKPLRAVSPRIPADIPAMDASDVRLYKTDKYKTNQYYYVLLITQSLRLKPIHYYKISLQLTVPQYARPRKAAGLPVAKMQAELKRIPPSCCKFNFKNTKVTINIFPTYFHFCHNFTVAALYYTLTGPHKSLLLYNLQWQAKLIKKKIQGQISRCTDSNWICGLPVIGKPLAMV